jgi:hypothetical protein
MSVNGPSYRKGQWCGSQPKMSSTSRKSAHEQEHEYEQRAYSRGYTELVEALGTTAVQRTRSSLAAGWFLHLGGPPNWQVPSSALISRADSKDSNAAELGAA